MVALGKAQLLNDLKNFSKLVAKRPPGFSKIPLKLNILEKMGTSRYFEIVI